MLFVFTMSYLVIQVGHSGNKLGQSFFTKLADITAKKKNSKNYEFLDKSDSRFFSYYEKEDKKCANAILLDTYPVVIQDLIKPSKTSWYYGSDSYKFLKSRPIPSTWPLEYKVLGPLFKEFILDAVRKELECYDQFYGFLLFGSISELGNCGLSSYVTELLHNDFSSASLANICVWPGEIGMAGPEIYNAVLNLSTLQNFSDAIFILENDYFMKLCMQKMGMEDACLEDFFSIASYQLANLLLPVDNCSSSYPTLNDMLSVLVPHPQFKLINLRSVPQQPFSSLPFSSYDWSTLFRSLRRILLYSTDIYDVSSKSKSSFPITSSPVTLTNLLLLRGKDCESADINYLHKPQFPYASWVPKASRLKIWTHSSPFLSCDRTALLANNGQLSVACVDKMTQSVWNYFARKAYFQHFERHGLTEEEFFLSYCDVQQIVNSYKSLKS